MYARFVVLPLTPAAHGDTASLRVAAIAAVLARRHGLSAMGVGSSCTLGLFAARHSGDLTLTLCVTASSDTIRLRLSELITKRWSAKGDSLRRELQDTLRVEFGSPVRP